MRTKLTPLCGPTRGAGGSLAHSSRLALWARSQEARVHCATYATSTASAVGTAPAWPKRPRTGCPPSTGAIPSSCALASGAAHGPSLGPRRYLHRPAPKRPRQPAELDAPTAAVRAQALAGTKRPRVEDPSSSSRGLGPILACSSSSGGPSPATRKRARPAGTPGLPQSTHPSPGSAPKRTATATASARHSRPYDYG